MSGATGGVGLEKPAAVWYDGRKEQEPMIEQLLSNLPTLPEPTKPPVFLVTDRLPGVWRGNLDGVEYVVIDRATEDTMRRALAGVTVGPLQVPYMTGIEFRGDNDLVALLLAQTMHMESR